MVLSQASCELFEIFWWVGQRFFVNIQSCCDLCCFPRCKWRLCHGVYPMAQLLGMKTLAPDS